jgi:cytochrome c-type biogenesis protein CcmH
MRIFLISLILLVINAAKLIAAEDFLPQQQESRAQSLFLQVKCVVCEGQVIENSNSQVAFELRKLIREKIQSGLNNEQIKSYLVESYGPEILTSPPFNNQTILLWALPIIFAIFGLFFIYKHRTNYTSNE